MDGDCFGGMHKVWALMEVENGLYTKSTQAVPMEKTGARQAKQSEYIRRRQFLSHPAKTLLFRAHYLIILLLLPPYEGNVSY
jgi:hypothetical protein